MYVYTEKPSLDVLGGDRVGGVGEKQKRPKTKQWKLRNSKPPTNMEKQNETQKYAKTQNKNKKPMEATKKQFQNKEEKSKNKTQSITHTYIIYAT